MIITDESTITNQRVTGYTSPKTHLRSDAGTGIKAMRRQHLRNRPFVGWDGEGYTLSSGSHHYALFGSSTGLRSVGRSLTWRNCLPLLFDTPPDCIHVIFAGTYDVVMMFHHETEVPRLLHGETVYLDQYKIRYLRGKMLTVTDRELKRTVTLYDVFTFFGTSFVKACREYLGDSEVLDQIEELKLQRNTFTRADVMEGKAGPYMAQELSMLVALMNDLREKLALVNIHPNRWHGPGAVASSVLKREKINKHKGVYDDGFRRVAESAYYGGRFEQFQRGSIVDGQVYQYDIRSAYPDAMRFLPDLEGATWHHHKGPGERNLYGLYHVKCRDTGHPIGYLPYRSSSGSIYYPRWIDGWYWGVEIPDHLWGSVVEGYSVDIPSTLRPFAFVEDMYIQRAKLKRANQPHQLALKLALNSLYGKLAQSKGAKQDAHGEWKYPTFHEVVWAGLITAYTRRKISDALHSVDPSHVIATETDSVFTTTPLTVEVGERLGEWDCETLDGIRYIQSGVSLIRQDDRWSFKTRGFTVKRHQNEVAIWSDFLKMKNPVLTIRQTRFGTDPRQKTFGQWYDTLHNLRLDHNLTEKRIHSWCPACDTGGYDVCMHRLVVPPISEGPSTPYRFLWRGTEEMVDPLGLSNFEEPILKLEYAT